MRYAVRMHRNHHEQKAGIDAEQDHHPWGNYEREMTGVLALQSELVQAIASEIKAQLTTRESERPQTTREVDPKVYDATFKGRQPSTTRPARNKFVRRSNYSKRRSTWDLATWTLQPSSTEVRYRVQDRTVLVLYCRVPA